MNTNTNTNTNTNKAGRKLPAINEITDRSFTIIDLIAVNNNVKAPRIRGFIKRNVSVGNYVVIGTQKSGKRGKPAIVYSYNTTKVSSATN